MLLKYCKSNLKRAILLMAPFFFIACEKQNGELGFDQVIGGVSFTDVRTFDVITHSQNVDSLLVALPYDAQILLGGYGGNRLLGAREDAYTGTSFASFTSQMVLEQLNPDFSGITKLDSVNLILELNGSYGDTTQTMSIGVFSLAEGLNREDTVYSNFQPQEGQQLGALNNYTLRPDATVFYDTALIPPSIVIPLDTNFFTDLILGPNVGSNLSGNELFVEYFKGMHIRTTQVGGPMAYLNLLAANSRLLIYYQDQDGATQQFALRFTASGETTPIHFSMFSQDYANSIYTPNMQDSINGEMATYVQTMGGVATVLEVLSLNEIIDSGFVINRALIEIGTSRGTGSGLPPVSSLEVREFEGGRPNSATIDFTFGSSRGDGTLRLGELRDSRYVFDLTRHIFAITNQNRENLKMAIVPVSKATVANQTILEGGTRTNPLKLTVYYTKP